MFYVKILIKKETPPSAEMSESFMTIYDETIFMSVEINVF